MTTLRRWLFGGSIAVLAGLVSLIVAEAGIRFFAPQPVGTSYQDPYGLAMHVPGLRTYLPQYGQWVSFNSAGMRDRERSIQRSPGVYRILLLGDSFVEASQVSFDSSLSARLERVLSKQSGHAVEVISAGVSGWGTDDELRYLTEYGLRYHPDLVLVAMTLHNDVSDNLREEWHAVAGDSLVDRPHQAYSSLDYAIVKLKAQLASRFQLYQLWRKVRHGREIRRAGAALRSHVVDLCTAPTPKQIDQGLLLTSLLLGRMKGVTDSAGMRLAIVMLPLRFQLSDTSYAEFIREADLPPAALPFGKPQRDMSAIAERAGIPVIDLLPGFRAWTAADSAPLYLSWDGHWNSAGHGLAAALLSDQLIAEGLVH